MLDSTERHFKKIRNAQHNTEQGQTNSVLIKSNRSLNTLVEYAKKNLMDMKTSKNTASNTFKNSSAFWLKQVAANRNRQKKRELTNKRPKRNKKPIIARGNIKEKDSTLISVRLKKAIMAGLWPTAAPLRTPTSRVPMLTSEENESLTKKRKSAQKMQSQSSDEEYFKTLLSEGKKTVGGPPLIPALKNLKEKLISRGQWGGEKVKGKDKDNK